MRLPSANQHNPSHDLKVGDTFKSAGTLIVHGGGQPDTDHHRVSVKHSVVNLAKKVLDPSKKAIDGLSKSTAEAVAKGVLKYIGEKA